MRKHAALPRYEEAARANADFVFDVHGGLRMFAPLLVCSHWSPLLGTMTQSDVLFAGRHWSRTGQVLTLPSIRKFWSPLDPESLEQAEARQVRDS